MAVPARFTGPLPAACDLVIVGAGVIGICTALFAAQRGMRVVVCEKGRVAGEQSSRNWGWIRQQGRDLGELPIMVESLRYWQGFSQKLGPGLGFRQAGVTYLAATDADLARHQAWLDAAGPMDSRLLSRAEVARAFPALTTPVAGALHTASDGRAEPFTAVPMLAAMASEAGVVIVEGCAVRALDVAGGQIAGVVTEQGRVACAQVLVAGGAWSSLLLRNHAIALPQLSVRASVSETGPLPDVCGGAVSLGAWAIRRRTDGGYTLTPSGGEVLPVGPDAVRSLRWYLPQLRRDPFGKPLRPAAPRGFPDAWTTPRRWSPDGASPFEAMRVLDPAPDLRALDAARQAVMAAFPALGEVRLRSTWAGMIDTLPDIVPVLDRVAAMPGLWLATGLSGHGFGIGPGVGRVMADLLAGAAPGHDLTRFRFGRFAGPVRVDFGAAL